jgi:protoheme IX farnesyltransferase
VLKLVNLLVYTLLKRKTPFAIIPGSLVGAIPPAVGWVAAGGYLFDPQIIIISFFFFIWQIPHFWLLLLIFDKDYKQAIPLFGLVKLVPVNLLLFLGGIFLTWKAFKLITETENDHSFRFAFRYINLFALFVVFLVSLDKLIIR